jgi:Flp pilus assembly protein CpaB
MKNQLPLTTVDWTEKFKRQKIKFLTVSLLLAFFASLIGYKTLYRAKTQAETINVVVASKNIPRHKKIKSTDLEFRKIRRDQVPEYAIFQPKDAQDKISLITIPKNQIITSTLFKEIANPESLSAELSDDKMAISIGFDWLSAPVPDIKVGDTVDIIASEAHEIKKESGEKVTVSKAVFPIRDVRVLRVEKGGNYGKDGHLVLEVTEEQANNLMATKALKVLLNIIIKQ